MQAAKKYLAWIVIGLVIAVSLGFYFVHVGALKARLRQENQEIVNQTRGFGNFVSTLREKVPTPRDLEIGGEFLTDILNEGRRTSAIWMQYGRYFDRGIAGGEVVYPDGEKYRDRVGKPIPPLVFADFLSSQYLTTMVEAEVGLQKQMIPFWEKMLAQSSYATDYRATREKAEAVGKEGAPMVAAEEAHIFAPNQMIPFKLNEKFDNPQKRLRYWRNFLVFRDVLMRGVAGSVAKVRRDVIGFERAPADFDETTGKLKTEILRGEGGRFIENLEALEVRQIAVGDGVVPTFDGSNKEAADKAPQPNPGAPAAEGGKPGHLYYDVFEVRLGITAHLKVVDELMRELVKTNDLFYVPVSQKVLRLPDTATLGNYVMPRGENAVKPIADAAYAETPAVPVNVFLAFEHESPVKAELIYHVYRPRLEGSANPKEGAEGDEETNQ